MKRYKKGLDGCGARGVTPNVKTSREDRTPTYAPPVALLPTELNKVPGQPPHVEQEEVLRHMSAKIHYMYRFQEGYGYLQLHQSGRSKQGERRMIT
jgi:hypothetical protein